MLRKALVSHWCKAAQSEKKFHLPKKKHPWTAKKLDWCLLESYQKVSAEKEVFNSSSWHITYEDVWGQWPVSSTISQRGLQLFLRQHVRFCDTLTLLLRNFLFIFYFPIYPKKVIFTSDKSQSLYSHKTLIWMSELRQVFAWYEDTANSLIDTNYKTLWIKIFCSAFGLLHYTTFASLVL